MLESKIKTEPQQEQVKRVHHRKMIWGLAFGGIALVAAVSLLFHNWSGIITKLGLASTESHTFVVEDKNHQLFNEDSSYEAVAAKVGPSVVSIVATKSASSFFGRDLTQTASGSGVILSADGYIITNKHVIDNAEGLVVITADDKAYEDVKIVAVDPNNDLAFLKINQATGLQAIELGDSKTLKVGQQVLAIGNALGEYQNTVTNGIISGVGRSIVAQDASSLKSEGLSDLIQTNAAINSGNSGGALVNAGGQLIGINTAVAQNANGVGFAIPIGAAKGLIRQLGRARTPQRAYLGISYVNLTAPLAKQYKIKPSKGAFIDQNAGVMAGSPAARAGLHNGDVIVKVNDHLVGVVGGLATLVSEYVPGETIKLTVWRSDQIMELDLTLEAWPVQ